MAENTQNKPAVVPTLSSTPIQMTKIFGGNDAKRMSFDENAPYQPQYSTSPLSSLLSQSGTTYPAGYNPQRRDSLKNMWLTQDFGTDWIESSRAEIFTSDAINITTTNFIASGGDEEMNQKNYDTFLLPSCFSRVF